MNVATSLGRALLAATIIIGVSAFLTWIAPAYIGHEMAHRLIGAMLGAVVVVYADGIPKLLVPRARLRCSPAQDQAARRYAGRVLVLGGLGYILAWFAMPLGMAGLTGGAVLATALLLAIARCWRMGGNDSAT